MSGAEWLHFFIGFLAFALMLVGLVGTVLPVLPSIELIWVGTLGYGVLGWLLLGSLGQWSPWLFGLEAVILIIGEVVMWGVGYMTSRQTGAAWRVVARRMVL